MGHSSTVILFWRLIEGKSRAEGADYRLSIINTGCVVPQHNSELAGIRRCESIGSGREAGDACVTQR
jgi:hypothetical protein